MTMNELLLRECRSFHAMIGRFEQIIKGMPELAIEQVIKEAKAENAAETSAGEGGERKPATRNKAETPCAAEVKAAGFCAFTQASLFDGVDNADKTADANAAKNPFTGKIPKSAKIQKKPVRRRGTPGIDKAKAMENFRKIVNGREILDLKDVNLIFGYNESTSGTFISCAVKRGDLMTIRYGQHTKFLAKDVKDFVKRWYAQEVQQGE